MIAPPGQMSYDRAPLVRIPDGNLYRVIFMALREGLQAGAGQWALVKSVPRLARRSTLGVSACLCPRQPTQSFQSSTEMNSTLGMFFSSSVVRSGLSGIGLSCSTPDGSRFVESGV